jgi:NAD(P)-dependent dehydrogenase (short-subunit alcohol dehydrogenase family)
MTARSQDKGHTARDQILQQVPGASLEIMVLDLASLASIQAFAANYAAQHDRLDMLINNAGVMAPPRCETADGFEMQFGVNHLGHFALTGLLLELLLKTPGSRVVTVSSQAQFMGRINFDDLQGERGYTPYGAYGQSKLANVLFAFELQRRLEAAGAETISVVTHPGFAGTNLQSSSAAANDSPLQARLYEIGIALLAQSAEKGTRPQLYAATMPDVKGGEHLAVAHLHVRGPVARVKAVRRAYNEDVARRLWAVSEQLTGVKYSALDQPQAEASTVTSPASV